MASGIWHLACQTYALNLIDSHSGQKQAPQLFSSSKSFRIAKPTPSSAKSLAKLSPISKWLFKPPLLFKSPLLSKFALVFAPLLLLSYTQGAQALSADTANTIHGSGPYLTFDGGRTKITDTESLFFIELQDGRRYSKLNSPTRTNPITLPSTSRTFNDIKMIIPRSQVSVTMNDLVAQGNWGDDDGDGQGSNGVTATGMIFLTISDKDGNSVYRSTPLDICKSPYMITLGSMGGTLETRYGVPKSTTFRANSAAYYVKPDSSDSCYFVQSVRPNLYMGGTGVNISLPLGGSRLDSSSYAGPSNIWDPTKGFLVQSTSPSSYDQNFPTTGADGLYFDLDIGGGDASQLRWSTVSHGGITATVSWVKPRTDSHQNQWENNMQHDTWISDKSKYVTRVTLTGPRASSTQINSSNPSPLNKPILPQTFELEGRDSSGNVVVKYGFVLKQWFVNRGTQYKPYNEQLAWCNRLGYRLSRVRDLTNSNYRNLGASPRSSSNNYMRHIGAGFFTEWGYMSQYADAGFILNYWTSDSVNSSEPFIVLSLEGLVKSRAAFENDRGLCTTP